MRVDVQVRGLPELKADLERLSDAAQGRMLRNCTMAGARVAANQARLLAPVGATGELKESITKRLRRQKPGSTRQEILVGVARPRSRIVGLLEFGSSHQRGVLFATGARPHAYRRCADHARRVPGRH
jgi:Bacteriophage HK97-gp10, putative tail-component